MKTNVKRLLKLFLFLLLLGSLTTACDKKKDEGTVAVKLTDDPFPVQFIGAVNVEITKIELKDTNDNYVTVFEGHKTINVADYTNGTTANVTLSNVPDGTYNKARVTIGDVSVTLTNNTTFTFNANGSMQAEVKIGPALEVQNGQFGNLLFDIDLADSLEFSGNFLGDWITDITQITGIADFEPDFRAVDLDKTGSVSGTVVDVNGNPAAYARVEVEYDYDDDGMPDSVSTHAKADGSFKIIGLPQGTYKLKVDTEDNGEAEIDNVNVAVKQTTTVNVSLQ